MYEVKNAGETPTHQPEVHAQVLAEIKAMGDNHKVAVDELQTSIAALKKHVDQYGDNMDALAEQKFQKLSEDILTRQEAVEKAHKSMEEAAGKRFEEMELAIKRFGKFGPSGDMDEQKLWDLAHEFKTSQMVLRGALPKGGLKTEEVSTEELLEYQKRFSMFMRYDEKQIGPEDWKYLSVGSDPDGGILVPPTLSGRIITKIYEMDPMRSLCTVEQIGTGALEIMEDKDEAEVGWEGQEVVAGAETDTPQFGKKRIPVHVQYARPKATQTLLEDATINVESWLAGKVSRKFARNEGTQFITGTGVGVPRGILTYADGTTWGTVEQVAMGAAANLTTDGFIDVMYALISEYMERSTWLMNRLTVARTMKLKDGDGQYIWRPGLVAGQPSTILGLPVRMSTSMPVVAANALSVALGDWETAYTIVDRLGITVQRDPYTKKPFVEFYTRRRLGGDVTNFEAYKIGKISV